MENEVYEIIDAHTHVFPDGIAEKSQKGVGEFYDLPMFTCGTVENLKKVQQEKRLIHGKYYKVSYQLICSPAVTEKQTVSINKFISDLVRSDKSFIGFGTVHPDNENYTEIIEDIKKSGLKGVKFHSDFQRFNINDPKMFKIYQCAARNNLPILFHMGDKKFDYSNPFRLTEVIEKVPDLRIIAAHMGGYSQWDKAFCLPVCDNLYFDISSSLSFISEQTFMDFINKYGYKHFFFGSDFPMWDPYTELEKILNIPLDEKIRKSILYDNFVEFLT